MTVTIKKNVDVQATLEAKQLKYQVKRDLSGDVQFENMASVGLLATTISAVNNSNTTTGTTTGGWNFVNLPKVVYDASGSTKGLTIKINGVTKTSTSWTAGSFSGTFTPATRQITSTTTGTNTIQLKVFARNGANLSATFASSMQKNDKYTVMK